MASSIEPTSGESCSNEALRALIHDHPGETPVLLRIPAGPGREQRMQLRLGVAYDAELSAAIKRRLGGSVELRLVSPD